MANLHAVVATAVTVTGTAETVVAVLTPFNENEPTGSSPDFDNTPSLGAQGVLLYGSVNALLPASATAVTLRIRKGSLTGTLVDTALTSAATASTTVDKGITALDPTYLQTDVVYVLTMAMTGPTLAATVNHATLTAQDATSYE